MAHAPLVDHGEQGSAPREHLWSGVLGFASFMLVLVGGFHILGGLVGLFEGNHYLVPAADLIISVSYLVWGWFHLALGIAMILAGGALFARQPWTRVAIIVLAPLSALTNLAFMAAAPAWYALMILMDILVIYAVVVHFDAGSEIDY